MIRADLVAVVIRATGMTRLEATRAVEAFIETLRHSLVEGNRVELRGFGVFTVKSQKTGIGRNPKRPTEDVPIPPRVTVRFKAGKELRAALVDRQSPADSARRVEIGSG